MVRIYISTKNVSSSNKPTFIASGLKSPSVPSEDGNPDSNEFSTTATTPKGEVVLIQIQGELVNVQENLQKNTTESEVTLGLLKFEGENGDIPTLYIGSYRLEGRLVDLENPWLLVAPPIQDGHESLESCTFSPDQKRELNLTRGKMDIDHYQSHSHELLETCSSSISSFYGPDLTIPNTHTPTSKMDIDQDIPNSKMSLDASPFFLSTNASQKTAEWCLPTITIIRKKYLFKTRPNIM
ncbi:hypothetical protein G9A89_001490 [Geosiphon pyriformis]|nr:hypothetical protein G9A89_001490 [Geosiphon pyriformis]